MKNRLSQQSSVTTQCHADFKSIKPQWLIAAAPWMAGAGIAVGHILTSSNCSIPKQGSCSACGSCVVALGSLTAWALIKQKNDTVPFYEQKNK